MLLKSSTSVVFIRRASLMAGTAQRKKTKQKGGMTPCWDVSNQKMFRKSIKTQKMLSQLYFQYFFALLFLSPSDDRHRVKLHPLLGDPNSDYINANYIDVSLMLLFCFFLSWFNMGHK